ncbi:hypothetical protein U1Q18_037204 [Sarracenia purpurea var. burkii]
MFVVAVSAPSRSMRRRRSHLRSSPICSPSLTFSLAATSSVHHLCHLRPQVIVGWRTNHRRQPPRVPHFKGCSVGTLQWMGICYLMLGLAGRFRSSTKR